MRGVRRAALVGPFLAVPVWTATAASAATVTSPTPAASATSTPSCPGQGHPWTPVWWLGWGQPAALIGNLSPAPGSTVGVGSTVSFLVADARPFRTPLSRDVVVTVNGARVAVTAGTPESGVPVTYANPRLRGPRSTKCEVPFTFVLPATISGKAHISVTAFAADGRHETVRWSLTVGTTTVPDGAVGGLGVAALGGLALMALQLRRRRGAPRAGG